MAAMTAAAIAGGRAAAEAQATASKRSSADDAPAVAAAAAATRAAKATCEGRSTIGGNGGAAHSSSGSGGDGHSSSGTDAVVDRQSPQMSEDSVSGPFGGNGAASSDQQSAQAANLHPVADGGRGTAQSPTFATALPAPSLQPAESAAMVLPPREPSGQVLAVFLRLWSTLARVSRTFG